MKQSIWHAGKQLYFSAEVSSSDEAQALLDYERAQGRVACCLHEDGKHQIYVESKARRGKSVYLRIS